MWVAKSPNDRNPLAPHPRKISGNSLVNSEVASCRLDSTENSFGIDLFQSRKRRRLIPVHDVAPFVLQASAPSRGRVISWWAPWPCWCSASDWVFARHGTSRPIHTAIHCASDNQGTRNRFTPTPRRRQRPRCPSWRFVDPGEAAASGGSSCLEGCHGAAVTSRPLRDEASRLGRGSRESTPPGLKAAWDTEINLRSWALALGATRRTRLPL